MNERRLIDFYCDAGSEIGYGHIRRSIVLAKELTKVGFDVNLIGLSLTAKSLLPPAVKNSKPASVVLVDAPMVNYKIFEENRKFNRLCIGLDWFSDTDVPDINVVIFPHAPPQSKVSTYTGFEFVIVNPQFIKAKLESKTTDPNSALVVLGGGDLLGQSLDVAQKLFNLGYRVRLIQGPLAPEHKAIEGIEVFSNPENLAELYARSELLVTNGGSCLFEAAAMRKPVVVMPQTRLEGVISRYFSEKGALLGVGVDGLRRYSSLVGLTSAENGHRIVDGLGVKRIAHIIKEHAW